VEQLKNPARRIVSHRGHSHSGFPGMNDTLPSPLPVTTAERRTGTVTTLAQRRQRRPIVIVLGMHRSGTSLCSHVLSALGVDMADAIAVQESNEKGHWERRQIVDLNDRILEHFNRGFYTPHHDFGLPVAWWADPEVGEFRREIVALLAARMGEAPFGFKDPRTSRLIPMWLQIFGELRLEPKFIICLRNPAQVARSLHARDGFDPEIGEFRWFSYVVDCFRYTRNRDICVLEYETWFDAPATNIAKLREFLGPFSLDREFDIDAVVADIVDDQLRHDNPRLGEAQQPLIRTLYALARRAGDEPASRQQIQNIAAQYLSFDQLQRPFHRAFERNAEMALQLPVRERKITEIATAAKAAQAEIARLRAAQAQAEQAAQRTIAGLTRQRDRVIEQAAEAVHDEIAGLRDGLTQAAREATEQRQALAEAERKARELEPVVAELKAALARRERGAIGRFRGHLRRRSVKALTSAGDRARDAGDWALAAPFYRRVLERAPDLAPIWVQLGHALKEQGDYPAAEAAYRRALALDGSVVDTLLQLGHLLKLQDRPAEAADAFARAVQLDPAQKEAGTEVDFLCRHFIKQGDTARDARNWPATARHYRQALVWQPGLMPIWVQLGHALKERGDHAEAEFAYRRALALDPSLADTHLQLGHLLKLRGHRLQAVDAYAAAGRLDPQLLPARDALHALVGSWRSETERAILLNSVWEAAAGEPGSPDGGPLADRYGALSAEASRKTGTGHDVILLGVIDWHFRIQRPQHLATHLADTGARVFYISVALEPADGKGRFRIVESPHLGVFEIRLCLSGDLAESIYKGLSESAVGELQLALDELIGVLGIEAPIVLVEHPAWHKVACGVPGATVVYDCLDLATGFSNVANSLAAAEAAMLGVADLVIVSSQPLAEYVAQQRSSILIRNAAEVDFLAQGVADGALGERPVIGYFGAIAEWFNIEWIERCAAARPDWEFRLIGRTDGCDTSRAVELPNVRFYGEKPYQELPALLREFDVAIIPFRIVELTRCTNPVKLYEYMAAGKPVVAAAIPEVIEATDLVYIADDARSFVERIEEALVADSAPMRARRQAWAREHTWTNRVRQLMQALDASFPLVSVVILAYNNWDYTKACLFSVRNWSDYPNLEIIVVDNASTDGGREKLRALEPQDERVRLILNDANLGVAGGYNAGLRAARGDYVVLLNNDTFVTRGWVRDLIRPMQLDPRVGLVGPLTNNIGNEQKVSIAYANMQEMQQVARRFVRFRLRRTLEVANLAFFCVAIRRGVLEEIGLLDEAYGIGYFEDDDYCRRASEANYKLVIADDVFVHHYHSVSFDTLGEKAAEQMARNRAIFEQRWGSWSPHRYRDEAGFGA
jgi:GT2 family glycosyltransferase/glycosyltransferase involved in cell wall biosynthesis/Tfp pilus assembly protein PilF